MSKKFVSLLLAGIMIMGLITGCSCSGKEEPQKTATTVNLDNLKKADKRIEEVIESEEYKNADEDKRLELVKAVVDQLVMQHVVVEKSVKVLKEKGVVSFQFEGGGAGVIDTRDKEELEEEVDLPPESKVELTLEVGQEKAEEEGAVVVEQGEKTPVKVDTEAEWSKQPEPIPEVVVEPMTTNLKIRVYNAFEDNMYRNSVYADLLANWENDGIDEDDIILDNSKL